jgi:tripartite-type tricarboxylate transporter receptor subunit TctC
MKLSRRKFLHLAVSAALPTGSSVAWAQTYPTRSITMVVPFPAGGPTDTLARVAAEHMQRQLGQSVIVENVAGADGSIGAGRVARAAPDGYTIVEGIWNTHVANGAVYSLQYDLITDFEPIALLAGISYLIIAKRAMPAQDLTGFIAWLKANPDKAAAATAGVGSAQHVAGILFQKITGTRFQFVPYRGAAPAMQDLIAEHVDWMISTPNDALPQMRLGNVKAFAVMAKTRLASAPEIPTVDEAGLPGFYFSNFGAIWAPRGTPKTLIVKLNAAAVGALADANARAHLSSLGWEIPRADQQTPEALAALQRAEIEKWWPIIKSAGIKTQ